MINFESEEAETIYINALGSEYAILLQKSDESFDNSEANNLITKIKEYLDETCIDEYLSNGVLRNRFDYNSVLLKLKNDLANRLSKNSLRKL